MRNTSVREFRAKLAETLEGTEPVIVTRHGRNVALVYPLADPRRVPLEVRRRIAEALQHRTARALQVNPDAWRVTSPVIEAYKRDVDRTLIRENLKKTAEERVRALQELQRLAKEARKARK
jgi:prevent-host-death family protein